MSNCSFDGLLRRLGDACFGTNNQQFNVFMAKLGRELVPGAPGVPAPRPRHSNCGELHASADDYYEAGAVEGWNECRAEMLAALAATPAPVVPAEDVMREAFEEAVFLQYFMSTIQRTGMGGPCELMPVGCKTKERFVARSETGEYVELTLNAAWWAWQKAYTAALTPEVAYVRG